MAITNPDVLIGSMVVGLDGDKLGKVEDVYYDSETGKPEWAAVKSGVFGGLVSLLPLINATQHDDGLTAPLFQGAGEGGPPSRPGHRVERRR